VDTLETPFEKLVLILLSRYDVPIGYKDVWKIYDNYPNGTFAVVNQAGHCLQIEQPDIFNAHVKAWVDQVEVGY
jgi:pimeloyl-ACP methyl ester carboxylesterase